MYVTNVDEEGEQDLVVTAVSDTTVRVDTVSSAVDTKETQVVYLTNAEVTSDALDDTLTIDVKTYSY